MDNSLEELENELGRLSPRPPSAALLGRLEHELGPATPAPASRRYVSATSLRSWKWAGWSLAGAATVVALLLVMRFAREPSVSLPAVASTHMAVTTPAPANRYEPVKATSVLYDLKEDGLATLPDQTEGRQVRYRYVDTYTWRNPATKASLRWSVPRDEVRVIRASLN
jgi:anti-sigma-K factor RskA